MLELLIAIVFREFALRRAGMPFWLFFALALSEALICEYLLFSFFFSFHSHALRCFHLRLSSSRLIVKSSKYFSR